MRVDSEAVPEFLSEIKKPKLDMLPLEDKSKLMRYLWKSSIKKVKGIVNVMRALKFIHNEIYTYGAFHFHNYNEADELKKKKKGRNKMVSSLSLSQIILPTSRFK